MVNTQTQKKPATPVSMLAHADPREEMLAHADPREETLAHALQLLRQCYYAGEYDTSSAIFTQFPEIADVLNHIQQVQTNIVLLARGEITAPVPLKGYTGNILKELQTNLHKIVGKARQVTVGDFSGNAGSMGELSEAFDIMGATLQSALSRLEKQKKDLTDLSESLQREIDARIAVEEHLRREQLRLQKLASTDPLTGIANRRCFFQMAVREVERIRRTGSHACVAMLDIDHFKTLNDSLGHGAGDKALYRIARLISSAIRPYDIVGRYGGDEFIFLFPETTADASLVVLERLRDSVEKAHIGAGKGNPTITVSIGLTELHPKDDSGSAALEKAIIVADEALFRAKELSRNLVTIL